MLHEIKDHMQLGCRMLSAGCVDGNAVHENIHPVGHGGAVNRFIGRTLSAAEWVVRLFFYAVFGFLAGIGIMSLVDLFLLWVFPVCDDNGHDCGMPMMQVFYGMVAACVLTPLLLYAYAKHAIHDHERAAVGALLVAAVLCGVAAWLDIV